MSTEKIDKNIQIKAIQLENLRKKYPESAKIYEQLLELYPQSIVNQPKKVLQHLDYLCECGIPNGQRLFHLQAIQYHIKKLCEKRDIRTEYIYSKYKDIRKYSINEVTKIFEKQNKYLENKHIQLSELAKKIQIIMDQIGASYTEINLDGTITIISPNTSNPIIKVFNKKYANYMVPPIKIWYTDKMQIDLNEKKFIVI